MAHQIEEVDVITNSRPIKKRRGKDKALVAVSFVLIVLSGLIIAASVLMNVSLLGGSSGSIHSDYHTDHTIRHKVVNFLVCGIDDWEGRDMGERTDVIMVASFDMESKEVNVLQFPRDTYIPENYTTNKINAVYGASTDGGIDGLAKVIYSNFGVTLDHYVTVNLDGVHSIVDTLGGIEVNVPVRISLDGVTLQPGLQTLDGNQTLAVVRERYAYGGADTSRMHTQRLVLAALVSKMLSMPKSDLIGLVPTLIGYVNTDLTINQALGLLDDTEGLEMENISMYTLPGEAIRTSYWYYSVYKDEVADLLNEKFRPYSAKIAEKDLGCVEIKGITGENRGQLDYGNFGAIDGTNNGRTEDVSASSNSRRND